MRWRWRAARAARCSWTGPACRCCRACATLAAQGFVTGASGRNWAGYGSDVLLPDGFAAEDRALLTDPQTSGGLLVACDPAALDAVLAGIRPPWFRSMRRWSAASPMPAARRGCAWPDTGSRTKASRSANRGIAVVPKDCCLRRLLSPPRQSRRGGAGGAQPNSCSLRRPACATLERSKARVLSNDEHAQRAVSSHRSLEIGAQPSMKQCVPYCAYSSASGTIGDRMKSLKRSHSDTSGSSSCSTSRSSSMPAQ